MGLFLGCPPPQEGGVSEMMMFDLGLIIRSQSCVLMLWDPSQLICLSRTPRCCLYWLLSSHSLRQIPQPLLLDLPSKYTPHPLLPPVQPSPECKLRSPKLL